MLNKELLDILVCPQCKKPVRQEEARADEAAQGWLVCEACRKRYPIRNGIPIMLIEEAEAPRGVA